MILEIANFSVDSGSKEVDSEIFFTKSEDKLSNFVAVKTGEKFRYLVSSIHPDVEVSPEESVNA